MTQAMLRTVRIQLVPLCDHHLEGEVELDADPEVMRYLGRPRQRTEVERAHRRRLAAAARVPELGFWAGLVDGSLSGHRTAGYRHAAGQDVTMPAIPESTKISLTQRQREHAKLKWPQWTCATAASSRTSPPS